MEVRGQSCSEGADCAGITPERPLLRHGKNSVSMRKESSEKPFGGGSLCRDGWDRSQLGGDQCGGRVWCCADLLEWADRVFVMEQKQRRYRNAHFADSLKDKKIVCLNIPDGYSYMQPEPVAVLRAKVLPLLRRS
jgi:predicted protein tyrosine phosphatase